MDRPYLVDHNLNDDVWFKLNEDLFDTGRLMFLSVIQKRKLLPNNEGFYTLKLWEFCQLFGTGMYNGARGMQTNIKITKGL